MASNLKKAGSVIKKSFRSRRYASLDLDENMYTDASPHKATGSEHRNKFSLRESSMNDTVASSITAPQEENNTTANQSGLKRASSMTQSMREAVGTIRQKFRQSTRRLSRLQNQTPVRAGKRRYSMGGRDVKMSSPFQIETPKRTNSRNAKACLSVETPTRLRREVEALTSNMQALSALTPNTLNARARARRAPPLTNGSLKTPRATRRSVSTVIY